MSAFGYVEKLISILRKKLLKPVLFVLRLILWIIWDFSGVRFIFRKVKPLTNSDETKETYRKPATFLIWIVALYVASFGFASQKFESKLSKAEHKANILVTQLSSPHFKNILQRIPRIQKLKCPVRPEFLKPHSIFASVFLESIPCDGIIEEMKSVIESWKNNLEGIFFKEVQLVGINLNGANLERSTWLGSNFEEADLKGSNLEKVIFLSNNFKRTIFDGANLKKAKFQISNLEGVTFNPSYTLNIPHYKSNFNGMRPLHKSTKKINKPPIW